MYLGEVEVVGEVGKRDGGVVFILNVSRVPFLFEPT